MKAVASIAIALLLVPTSIHALGGPVVGEEPEDAWIWSPAANAELDIRAVIEQLESLGLAYHEYEALHMVAFVGTEIHAQLMLASFGGNVERNQFYDLHLENSVPAIEADVVADAIGLVRDGPSVVIIDTGIDSQHPDFQSGNLAANYQTDRTGGLVTGVTESDAVVDEAGHGTHVAGIVAGSGQALGEGDAQHDRFKGVYHNGRIVGFQATADSEGGEARVDTLAALKAMDWVLTDGHEFDVKVVQNSWGTGGDFAPDSAVSKATLDLYLAGMTVVFSAGNRGAEEEALNSFCQAPWLLCVANVDNSGTLADTSSVGTSSGTYRPYAHPDVAAPGTFVVAAGSTTSVEESPGQPDFFNQQPDPSEELYEVRTGTSMAAPHVAGAAALMLAANPHLSPDQVMDVLVETATPSAHSLNEVGVGMINAREAYNLAIQTPGNREAFEAGQQVKYAGPASGDSLYTVDPTSLGYTSNPTGTAVTIPPKSAPEQVLDFVVRVVDAPLEEQILFGGIALAVLAGIIWLIAGAGTKKGRARRKQRRLQAQVKKAEKMLEEANRLAVKAGLEPASFGIGTSAAVEAEANEVDLAGPAAASGGAELEDSSKSGA